MFSPHINSALADLNQEIETLKKVLVELRGNKTMASPNQSQRKSQINLQLQKTPIAIIGMASIFPEAKNLQQFWENIIHEVDCIKEVPPSRWNVEEYYDPDPRTPDKTYCKRGGFIPDIDFNPMEFGLPPNILEVTDISQLLSLVVAKQAMEDAGYGRSREFDREHTGVILGTVGRQLSAPLSARLQYPLWERVLKNSGICEEETQKIVEKLKLAYVKWEENSFPGMLSNLVAGRIANRLDFGGINCTVDAACASSLAAFKMAISELVERRCDIMLTGGVDTDNSAFTYLCFSKTPALSRTQQSRPFDAKSDGIMLGEGLGMVVLKRLEDAERDGDRIYAVIKGVGTSSDGRYKSIYAPRVEGQVKALDRAYEDAGFSPASLGLVEAHGTGTMAGDPTEFTALSAVLAEDPPPNQSIALGSVKSQIGHTKTAAGVASVIKTALALHHKILPPTINVTEPNPKLAIKNSPFYLNTKTRPWFRVNEATPRRAGVSSFGFGGTNFHLVLEEYQPEQEGAYRLHSCPQPVLLSGENPQQLLVSCQEALASLQSDDGDRFLARLVKSGKSLEVKTSWARVGFVAESLTEAISKLQTAIKLLKTQPGEAWEHPQGIYYRQSGLELSGRVVALFPGQGSQYLEMGRELASYFPELRSVYSQLDKLLTQDGLQPISRVVFPPPTFDPVLHQARDRQLQSPEYAQPAIGGFSFGLYKLLQQAGFKPNFVAGHSFGELTALWAAEVFNDEDYLSTIKSRGQAMATPNRTSTDSGAMLAIKADVAQVEAILRSFPRIAIANYNSPHQVVFAGAKSDIIQAQKNLEARGFSPILLPVAAAFHTSAVAHAQKPLARVLEAITLRPAQSRVYANLTGQLYSDNPQEIRTTLLEQITNSVRFREQIENIYADGGYCFVEIGPRRVLTNLVTEILGKRPHLAIALNGSRQKSSDRQLREAVLQLRIAGLALKDVDSYSLEPKIVEVENTSAKSAKLHFSLNGACYVSEKTKQAFEQALENGHHPNSSTSSTAKAEKTTTNGHQRQLTTESLSKNGHQPVIASSKEKTATMNQSPANSQTNYPTISQITPSTNGHSRNGTHPRTGQEQEPKKDHSSLVGNHQACLDIIESSLSQFNQHQSQTLQTHKHYLDNQLEYAKIFFHLMQQQQNLLFSSNAAKQSGELKSAILESWERNMMRFHDHQAQTLQSHEHSLAYQGEFSRNLFQLMQQKHNLLMADGSVSLSLAQTSYLDSEISLAENKHTLKSGFEIREKVENRSDNTPEKPENITPLDSTPYQSSVSLEPQLNGANLTAASQPQPLVSEPELDTEITDKVETVVTTDETVSMTMNLETLSEALLEVVSEKTGYPPEMLEMDMDLEADLGIDSIKRVEIMGGLMERFPDLPQPKLEELAEVELRTLTQVVNFIRELASSKTAIQFNAELVSDREPSSLNNGSVYLRENSPVLVHKSVTALVSAPETEPTAALNSPATPISTSLEQALLYIVSESTGYPVEMLDKDLDIEEDLGIDLIKRVEILGTLIEQFPDLRQPSPEELTSIEVHTLKQLVDYTRTLEEKKKSLSPVQI